ncbi:MAG: DUF4214 domain-containing protein, partial [Desulfobacterales bacterium]
MTKNLSLLITLFVVLMVNGTVLADATDDLISRYYLDILDRAADAGGAAGWNSEIQRCESLGIDIKEGFIALAKVFFNSEEYTSRNKSNTEYVTDLYQTFFNREPDHAGRDFWVGLLDQGLGRNVLMNFFVYGDEFRLYMEGLFGSGSSRPECNLVNDLYRGLQGR